MMPAAGERCSDAPPTLLPGFSHAKETGLGHVGERPGHFASCNVDQRSEVLHSSRVKDGCFAEMFNRPRLAISRRRTVLLLLLYFRDLETVGGVLPSNDLVLNPLM